MDDDKEKATDESILERSLRLTNHEMWTVSMQRRRLRVTEPEDGAGFTSRWWADAQFFILALWRLRQAALVASHIPALRGSILDAVRQFDQALPDLKSMRDVGEHAKDYAVDNPRRHRPSISRKHLEVGSWDGITFGWLGGKLHVDEAYAAAQGLFQQVRTALGASSLK